MIEWAVTSTVLTALVIGARYALRGKIGLRLQYGLWLLVLARLLIPVSFGGTAVSVANVAGRSTAAADRVVAYVGGAAAERSISEPDPTLPAAEQTAGYEETRDRQQAQLDAARAEPGTPVSVRDVLLGIWLGGAGVLAGIFLLSNLRFARALRRSRTRLDGTEARLAVYVTEAADTPCLFGLLRPAIYVTPEAAAHPETLAHTVAHEETHFRHGDHLWAVLRCAALALHWYNPVVWWAAVLSRRDGELACDEATIARLGEGQRAAYGRTLIDLTCKKPAALLVTATTMTGGAGGLKERIQLIARRPKTTVGILIVVVLLSLVAVSCTFTGATDDPDIRLPEKPAETVSDEGGADPAEEAVPAEEASPRKVAELPEETVAELAQQLKGDAQFLRQLDGYDPEWNNAVSFGAGWLDDQGRRHLEFRAGCLWPSVLMEAVLEESEDGSWTLASVGQAPGQWVSGTPEGTAMDEDQLEQWNDWLWPDAMEPTAIRQQFLTSIYRSPEEIDLYQLFYSGCADGGYLNSQWTSASAAEAEEVMGGPVHIDCSKVTAAEMESCLRTYLGLGLEDVWGYLLEKLTYSPKYDAYYHVHGDTNSGDLGPVEAGWILPDGSVRLWYSTYRFAGDSQRNEVALVPDGSGGWQFRYNLPVREEGNAAAELERILAELPEEPVRLALLTDIGVIADFDGTDCDNAVYFANNLAEYTYELVEVDAASSVRINLMPTAEDEHWCLTFYDDTEYVELAVGDGGGWTFRAQDSAPVGDIARWWYDEAEYQSFGGYWNQDAIVIPNQGQDYLAAAQAFCQALEETHLNVSGGSKYKYNFVECTVEAAEETTSAMRERGEIGENTWAFWLTTVFVPENEDAMEWSFAGNTGEYTGSDSEVPEGAWEYYRCGYITLEDDGWHGQLVGTSW